MINLRELAILEEGRLARAISEVAPESRLIAPEHGGGVLARGVAGTWANIAAGMGLAGPVPSFIIDEMIDWFEYRSIEPRVELCPFADPTLIAGLADRGFVVRLFENVFYRELSAQEHFAALDLLPAGITISPIDPADDAKVHECARVVAGAFAGDREPSAEAMSLTVACMLHPRTLTLAASHDGCIIAGGSIELHGASAALFGLSVHPGYRRRGIQQALIAARLHIAASRGVMVATISARPGVATERNARRMGFQVGYTKPVVARPGVELIPVVD